MKTTNRTFFISAFQSSKDLSTNANNHKALDMEIQMAFNVKATEVIGMYNGKQELSFAIYGDNNLEDKLLSLAKIFNQESMLIVYSDGAAELVFSKDSRKTIGKWKCLGENEGELKGRDYSYYGNNFYVVE